jgi:uncharacterized protein YcbK (DUF882 family)
MPFVGTRYFSLLTDPKLACSCGCGLLPEQDFMEKVDRARGMTSFSWPVTSGARCPAYNSTVSTTGATGPHTTRRAIDIGVSGWKALEVSKAFIVVGMTGIGVHQKGAHDKRFVHGDDLPDAPGQPRPHIWSY